MQSGIPRIHTASCYLETSQRDLSLHLLCRDLTANVYLVERNTHSKLASGWLEVTRGAGQK